MFPLSHTYISTKVTGKRDALLVLGSILPDIASTSAARLGEDEIHNSPGAFYDYVKKNTPELVDLALGVRLHSQIDGGADFYSDDPKIGYAKIEGAKISGEVAELLEIENGETSLALAHNFIELATDLHLYKNQRNIWILYKKALEGLGQYLPLVVSCIATYLQKDQTLVSNEITRLITIFNPGCFESQTRAVDEIVLPLINNRFQRKVLRAAVINILERALKITRPTYKAYLDSAVIAVRKNVS